MTSIVTAPALTAVAVRVILASLIADEDEFARWWPYVGTDLFSIDESYERIASIVTDYSKRHGHAPSFETIEDALRTDPRLSTADREVASDALKEVLKSPVEDWHHYRDHLRLYVRKRAHVVALQAAERHVETGERIGQILIRMKVVASSDVGHYLQEKLSIGYVSLKNHVLTEDLMRILDEEFVRSRRVVPLALQSGQLELAMVDPVDHETISAIEEMSGFKVVPKFALENEFEEFLERNQIKFS